MNQFPLLTAILLLPLLAIFILIALPRKAAQQIRSVAAVATTLPLLLAIYAYVTYDFAVGGMQFVERIPWLKGLGVRSALGVDGTSLPVLVRTPLI